MVSSDPGGREAVELCALSLALPGMRLFFFNLLVSLLSLGGLVQANREASLRSLVGVDGLVFVGLEVVGSSCGGGRASMYVGRWALGIGWTG